MPSAQSSTLPLAALNVLIVEDHYPTRSILRRMLSAAGVEHIRDAGDGREAIALLRATTPDLILLDYSLPGLNGLEIVRCVRAEPDFRARPIGIIMITGYVEPSHIAAARAVGIDAFLAKPFSARSLLARINAMFSSPAEAPENSILDMDDPKLAARRVPLHVASAAAPQVGA